MVKKLQWDSDFFDLNVGEINYDKNFQDSENEADFDLIYIIATEDFQLDLLDFENTFSETKIIFTKTVVGHDLKAEPIFKFEAVKMNIELLYELAYESGKNSRFLLDPRIDEIYFKRLYKAWIDNSINKKFADDILVYFEENQLKGFISYKTEIITMSVGLIAINASFQNKGIGAKLLKHLENLAFESGIAQIKIPTQLSNIQACNFYKKQGFTIKEQTYIKHFWKI